MNYTATIQALHSAAIGLEMIQGRLHATGATEHLTEELKTAIEINREALVEYAKNKLPPENFYGPEADFYWKALQAHQENWSALYFKGQKYTIESTKGAVCLLPIDAGKWEYVYE